MPQQIAPWPVSAAPRAWAEAEPPGHAGMNTLRALLEIPLWLAAAALLLPELVILWETIGAIWPARTPAGGGRSGSQPSATASGAGRATATVSRSARAAIVLPAHNEASQIEQTVRSLATQLGPADRLIVVADNCDDQTADLARAAGATVIERENRQARGKGFAIAFALDHLDADPPDVVVLIDADCQVSPGGIERLVGLAMSLARPIQAEYLIRSPPRPTPVAVVSGLAVMIRNRVRPRGLDRFGLPCHLTGSGMAFPWKILREAPATGSELVEDLVMGIEMALGGHPPRFCPEVKVTSELPEKREAAMSQRRRWEHGQLHTLVRQFPRLVLAGLRHRRPDLLALGLDLIVPPLALLVSLQVGVLLLGLVTGATGLTSFGPAALAGAGFALLGTAVGAAWLTFGREVAPLRYALFIPFYVLWKIPLYVSLAWRGKQRTWERTARRADSSSSNEGPVKATLDKPDLRP